MKINGYELTEIDDEIISEELLWAILKATGKFYYLSKKEDGKIGYACTCGHYGFSGYNRQMSIISNDKDFPIDEYKITWCINREDMKDLIPVPDDYKGGANYEKH